MELSPRPADLWIQGKCKDLVRSLLLVILLACSSWATSIQYPLTQPGPQGPPGEDGRDAGERNPVNIGADVRVYDSQYWSLHTGFAHDVKSGGNAIFGMVGLKVGKSYEEREIERLKEQINSLMAKEKEPSPPKEKPIRGVIRGQN
jgi:hypothetical protein